MTATYILGTGWEAGSLSLERWNPSFGGGEPTTIITSEPNTGVYSIQQNGGGSPGQYMLDISDLGLSDLYMGFFFNPHAALATNNNMFIRFVLSTGEFLDFRNTSADRWDAYVDGVLSASGGITFPDAYVNFQAHIIVADSGLMQCKINGVQDINFVGDTQPAGAATIDQIIFRAQTNDWRFDDFVLATDAYPGDVRFESLVPDGDNSVQWEPSAGGGNFAQVDEIPASGADFVRASGTLLKDKYDLEAWSSPSAKFPVLVTLHASARKEVADNSQLRFVVDDGTEDITTGSSLGLSDEYRASVYPNPPSGGSWDASVIDGLIVGVESEFNP